MNLPLIQAFTGFLQTHIARLCAQLLLCAGCAVFGVQAFAAEAQGLFQSEVVVTSRDDTGERTRAFTSGLQDVLIRLSGRADTLDNPLIQRQIQNTQSLVEGWAYQTRMVDGVEQLYLQINYFQPEVQRLLDGAGIPLWPANRPDTLLWVVTQDELGERTLADPAQMEPEVYQRLQDAAKRRGLPLRLPLLDAQDRIGLTAEQVWTMDQMALRTASQRYGAESILALRLYRTLTGDTYGKATYLFRDRVLELESLEDPEATFLDSAIALAAEELAGTFAVRLSSATTDSSSVTLDVSGVRGVADYAALLKYLDDLTVVNSVQVLAANGDKLSLQLRAGGQLRQLMETLTLDRRLVQQGEPAFTDAGVAVVPYLWQNQP
jgi:hypothetical protein